MVVPHKHSSLFRQSEIDEEKKFSNILKQESMRVASIVYLGVPHSAMEDIQIGQFLLMLYNLAP
jgi:hypothetical protein